MPSISITAKRMNTITANNVLLVTMAPLLCDRCLSAFHSRSLYQTALGTPALNYAELPPTIWRSGRRRDRLRRKCCVEQITNRRHAISNAERHRWRAAQRLMRSTEILISDIQADRRHVVFEAF